MLGRLIKKWQTTHFSGIKWVNPMQLHITLAFLGEIAEDLLKKVCQATQDIAQKTKPFTITIDATGVFPTSKRPRVLWCGCKGDIRSIEILQKDLQTALETMRFPLEKRPFSPHITLGRIRSVLDSAIITEFLRSPLESGPFIVKNITIYESRLLTNGPEYKIRERYPFMPEI